MELLLFTACALLVFGAAIGSFIAAQAYNVIHDQKVHLFDRSHCPLCKKTLPWKFLIPVLSFIFLRRKCHFCKKNISFFYFIVELLTSLVFICTGLLFHYFVSPLDIWDHLVYLHLGILLVFISTLLYISTIDMYLYAFPIKGILGVSLFFLVTSIVTSLPLPFLEAAGGLLTFGGIMLVLKLVGDFIWKTTTLGEGDLYLSALLGIFLGVSGSIVALYITVLLGAVVSIGIAVRLGKVKGIKVPFAPLLCIGAYIAYFAKEPIISWYASQFFI